MSVGSFDLNDQPKGCSLFDSDVGLFVVIGKPIGASVFSNPSLFELDSASDCVNEIMAMSSGMRTTCLRRRHYGYKVALGPRNQDARDNHIGNLLRYTDMVWIEKF